MLLRAAASLVAAASFAPVALGYHCLFDRCAKRSRASTSSALDSLRRSCFHQGVPGRATVLLGKVWK